MKKSLILIVDDNPLNIQVLGALLKRDDLEIAVATNGERAIAIAKSKLPDLILLDIMMPVMDGYQVCQILKTDEETKDIPIIFLTAKIEESDVLKAFDLGAVDYLKKPFNPSELIARVNTHLKLKHYLVDIEEKNLKLEQLNKDKNEFLGIAAHDLKNPIFSISLLASFLRDEEVSPNDVKSFSNDIVATSERMLELIKNLLDINSIEQGRVNFTPQYYNLADIAASSIENYKTRAQNKDISIHFESLNYPFDIFVDLNSCYQILDNLISNAIKYTPSGKNVFVNVYADNDGGVFKIRDEGPGFTEDDKTKLFGKFARLSAQPTGKEHSTGLGLSIVKKYVEMNNAMIWVDSTPGSGSTFYVKFPLVD